MPVLTGFIFVPVVLALREALTELGVIGAVMSSSGGEDDDSDYAEHSQQPSQVHSACAFVAIIGLALVADIRVAPPPYPQRYQSQSQRVVRLTPEDERKGVNRIVKLMLSKDESKRAVSRGDISAALKAEGVPAGNANVNSLIESAKKRLRHVFGFELKEGTKSELHADAVFSQASQVLYSVFFWPGPMARETYPCLFAVRVKL